MEQHGAVYACRACDVDHVLHGAVAPPDSVGVLGSEVLRVVDDHVGTLQELNVPGVVPVRQHVTARAERGIERLVVGDVADDGAIALDPIPQSECRVIQVLRPHHEIADLERALDELVVPDCGAELVEARPGSTGSSSGRQASDPATRRGLLDRTRPSGHRRRAVRRTADPGCDPSGYGRGGSIRSPPRRRVVTPRGALDQGLERPFRSRTRSASRDRTGARHTRCCLRTARSMVPGVAMEPRVPQYRIRIPAGCPMQLRPAALATVAREWLPRPLRRVGRVDPVSSVPGG